jgi:glycosyltransferase involved in cell wall biosynthesis
MIAGRGPDQPSRISVVICCYREDRFELLMASIDSVRHQVRPAHELLVVVDHNPVLAQRVRAARGDVAVIESTEPKGLSGARNCGLKAATAEIVAFLDDDAEAPPDWLRQLEAPYADPAVLGVGGGAVPRWASGQPQWFPAEFYWVIGCTWRGLPEVTATTRNLIGCNMSFRREEALAAGGFAPEFSRRDRAIPNEETEFCIRLIRQNPERTLVFVPHAVVHHFVPEERTTARFFLARCWSEGRAKRVTTSLAGWSAGLAREQVYLRNTIPTAIWSGLREAAQGERSALKRVVAVAAGTIITLVAFALPSTPLPLHFRSSRHAARSL